MIPPTINPPAPEDDGLYCAGKRYAWQAFCDSDYMEWEMIAAPPGVVESDIQQTTPNGKVNFITFPVPGDYYFRIRCCKKV